MYIDDQGGIEGSITGGCVEGAVAAAAMEMLDADGRAAARHLRDQRRAGRHGRADVRRDRPHLHPRAQARAPRRGRCATSRRRSTHTPGRAGHAARRRACAGAKLFVDAERRRSARSARGELLDKQRRPRGAAACSPRAARAMRDFGADGASLGSGLRVYSSIQAEPPRMVVFGAIDFSAALAPLAKGLGYRVTIADPRSAFLASQPLLRRRRDRGRLARRGAGRRRARPARRGADLHPRPEARRARRAGRAAAPAPATSARSARATRPRTATAGCATSASPTRRSTASSRPAGWTSAPRPSRRPRSRCWPRSSPTAPGATDIPLREAEGPIRHADTTETNEREAAWPIPSR